MEKNCFFIWIATLALAACPFMIAQAQPVLQPQWVQHQPGPAHTEDIPIGVASDSAGNVYVVGSTSGLHHTGLDYVILKYSPRGRLFWWATYDSPTHDNDGPKDFILDAAGDVYVTGYAGMTNGGDFATVKFNAQGQPEWAVLYNGPVNGYDKGEAIALDAEGNVYVAGSSQGPGGGYDHLDIATVKYNHQGQEIWVARYNGPTDKDDEGADLAVDSQGNVYVTGRSDVSLGTESKFDYITIKYNSQGVQQWTATYNGPLNGWDEAKLLVLDEQSNVYVTGISHEGDITSWAADILTVKYDSTGVQQWVARLDGQGTYSYEVPLGLALDAEGNVIVAGFTTVGYNSAFLTAKYSNEGILQWTNIGNPVGSANSLAVDSDGNIYLTGETYGPTSSFDCITLKYGPLGNLLWIARYSEGNVPERGRGICLDGHGNVLVAGTLIQVNQADEDFLTLKYNQPQFTSRADLTTALVPEINPACQPNPFNPSTIISFELRAASYVTLEVFDICGRIVPVGAQRAAPLQMAAGTHQITFDGSGLPSGIYLYRLQGGNQTAVGKMVLMK